MSFRNIPPCDFSHINAKYHTHEAFPYFKEEMRDKSYGREELNQAWHFFQKGWEASLKDGSAAIEKWEY